MGVLTRLGQDGHLHRITPYLAGDRPEVRSGGHHIQSFPSGYQGLS
jgi:hypothetical protein